MAVDLAEVLRFGRYEPLFRIGRGGMAEVYAARILGEGGFQKRVAVKRMLPHLTEDPKFVDMFLDEARLAANISSPHVVSTFDLGRAADESLYLVMELVVGVTLADMCKHQKKTGQAIAPLLAVELIAQAAQGLDDAHEARAPSGEPMHLVHRDVTPRNILVGVDGRVRVVDFGIAHALRRLSTTLDGEKKGTFAYWAPEQASDAPLDRRSDVWSLGVVAWELLCGRRLFKGATHELMAQIVEGAITPPAEMRPDIPKSVSDVVLTALARPPGERYATASQVGAALRRAALALGELPTSRAIGAYVELVGGEELEAVRTRIYASHGGGAGVEPATLPMATPATMGETTNVWAPGRGAKSLFTGEQTFVGASQLRDEAATVMTPAPSFQDSPTGPVAPEPEPDTWRDRAPLSGNAAAPPPRGVLSSPDADAPTVRKPTPYLEDGDTVHDTALPFVSRPDEDEEETRTKPRPAPPRTVHDEPAVDLRLVLLGGLAVALAVLFFFLGFMLSR